VIIVNLGQSILITITRDKVNTTNYIRLVLVRGKIIKGKRKGYTMSRGMIGKVKL